jgi:hypothetical protein
MGLVLLLTACSSPAIPTDNPQQTRTQQIAGKLYQSTTEEQQPPLSDGAISFDEYEAAMFRVETCLDEAGISHSPLELRPDGFTLDFTYELSGFDEISMDRCFERYVTDIWTVWYQQHIPTEVERAETTEMYVQCLEDGGIHLAGMVAPFEAKRVASYVSDLMADGALTADQDTVATECEAKYWILFAYPLEVSDL